MNKAELTARLTAHASMSTAGARALVGVVFSAIVDVLAGRKAGTLAGLGESLVRYRRSMRHSEPIANTCDSKE